MLLCTGTCRLLVVAKGTFTNVRCFGNEAYAAQCKPNEIHVFRMPCYETGGQWVKLRAIRVPIKKTGFTITLSVGNTIRCSSWRENKIHEFSRSDETWRTHGRVGTETAGQFNEPFICDDDVSGNMLIADRCNHRLQVMDSRGACRLVAMVTTVPMPISAAVYNNHLYIINNKCVYKYSPMVDAVPPVMPHL